MRFKTDYLYTGREDKAKYVWLKYRSLLEGRSILDVGADECHLRKYLDPQATYWGIGLGGSPDQIVDLEKENLPFEDNSYDTVLCLDVLEHIENIHTIFDELCRVTRRNLIISLPNPWHSFYKHLTRGSYDSQQMLKFYSLPLERPGDRHKWFFSYSEAEQFIRRRGAQNQLTVVQIDPLYIDKPAFPIRQLRELALWLLFRRGLKLQDFYYGTLWAVLEKTGNG